MDDIEQKILKYTQFWYEYVNTDHHKDRDCHFSIEKTWSYGKEPTYSFYHNGYIGSRSTSPKREKYEHALRDMQVWFEREIESAKEWVRHVEEDDHWNVDAKSKSREILERYGL